LSATEEKVAEVERRKPFIFCLSQNFVPQLIEKKLAYQINPDEAMKNLSPYFFMGVGKRKIIIGPFKLTGEPVYEEFIEPRTRMKIDPVFGGWIEELKKCPYRISFEPQVRIVYGLEWDDLARQIKRVDIRINPNSWQNLSQIELPEHVIKAIATRLLEINPSP